MGLQFSRILIDASNNDPPAHDPPQKSLPQLQASNEDTVSQQFDRDFRANLFDHMMLLRPYANRRIPMMQTEQPQTYKPSTQVPHSSRQPYMDPEIVTFSAVLNVHQLAARQVIGKDLPNFSGNPEEWPIFICSFEQSTACGYADIKILIWLQRCL